MATNTNIGFHEMLFSAAKRHYTIELIRQDMAARGDTVCGYNCSCCDCGEEMIIDPIGEG